MKSRLYYSIAVLCGGVLLATVWFGAPSARGQAIGEGAANVSCSFSHRLPDDPIIYPGKPGIAMSHDFFGHTTTTGNTTAEDLYTEHSSTCENAADNTSYWAPSLKLPDGRVVAPSYHKTYYQNRAFPANTHRRVTVIPPGLQMLAGDHRGTGPSVAVNFLCTGSKRGYTRTAPNDCVPDGNGNVQLNIALAFPNCWDGVHMHPFRSGRNNIAYANANGVCPEDYPVPLPHLSFNLAYQIGAVTDLTDAQLSMDPTLDQHGNVESLNWGSIYTAHADFFNGWTEDAMRYMVEYCMNLSRSCSSTVAYAFTRPTADATVRGGETANDNFGQAESLFTQRAVGGEPESKIYIMMPIPKGALDIPPEFTPQYRLLIWGGGVDATAIISAHSTATHWHEDHINSHNAPTCGGTSATLYLDTAKHYRYFNVTNLVKTAIAAGEETVSFCIRGNSSGNAFKFDSKEGANGAILYLYALNPL